MFEIKRSPWVLHYDGSSCNGCDIEVLACLTPVYDAERFGIINTGDPMQADILLITGGINSQNAPVVKQLYDQMPRPKVVCAIGVCACTGGIFKDCYNILGGADTVIPVDIYVPGCAARPQAIIDGIVKAVDLFQERLEKHKAWVKEHNLPPYADKHEEMEKLEKTETEEKTEVSVQTDNTKPIKQNSKSKNKKSSGKKRRSGKK